MNEEKILLEQSTFFCTWQANHECGKWALSPLWWSRYLPQCLLPVHTVAPSKARLQVASICRYLGYHFWLNKDYFFGGTSSSCVLLHQLSKVRISWDRVAPTWSAYPIFLGTKLGQDVRRKALCPSWPSCHASATAFRSPRVHPWGNTSCSIVILVLKTTLFSTVLARSVIPTAPQMGPDQVTEKANSCATHYFSCLSPSQQ